MAVLVLLPRLTPAEVVAAQFRPGPGGGLGPGERHQLLGKAVLNNSRIVFAFLDVPFPFGQFGFPGRHVAALPFQLLLGFGEF